MIPRKTDVKNKLQEIHHCLSTLAMKEEKNFDGRELEEVFECARNLRAMNGLPLDDSDKQLTQQITKLLDNLEGKYIHQLPKKNNDNQPSLEDSSEEEDSEVSDDDLDDYPDFDVPSSDEEAEQEEKPQQPCRYNLFQRQHFLYQILDPKRSGIEMVDSIRKDPIDPIDSSGSITNTCFKQT